MPTSSTPLEVGHTVTPARGPASTVEAYQLEPLRRRCEPGACCAMCTRKRAIPSRASTSRSTSSSSTRRITSHRRALRGLPVAVATPSTRSAVRQPADKCEHRLFLSATPHNDIRSRTAKALVSHVQDRTPGPLSSSRANECRRAGTGCDDRLYRYVRPRSRVLGRDVVHRVDRLERCT
jgi:hypothetical protein